MRTNVLNKRIKEKRLMSGKTLLEAANYIGVKEATMQRYESGKIQTIDYDVICKLANFYNTTPMYLMGWANDDEGIPELAKAAIEKNAVNDMRSERFLEKCKYLTDDEIEQTFAIMDVLIKGKDK